MVAKTCQLGQGVEMLPKVPWSCIERASPQGSKVPVCRVSKLLMSGIILMVFECISCVWVLGPFGQDAPGVS